MASIVSESRFLSVTYHMKNGGKVHFGTRMAINETGSFVLGGLDPAHLRCNDVTLNHRELPLPSRFCLLWRHTTQEESEEIWEILDLVPKSRLDYAVKDTPPSEARCFLEKKGATTPVRVGYEPLKVEEGDKIIIRLLHPHKRRESDQGHAGSERKGDPINPFIELEISQRKHEENVDDLSSGDSTVMICNPGTISGDTVKHPVSSLINDFQRENLLTKEVCEQLYCLYILLRQQMKGEKVTLWKKDQSERVLLESFKKLDDEITKANPKAFSEWLFENVDNDRRMRKNVVKDMAPDLTSFFRFVMRILQRYDLGEVRTRMSRWAGWKFGMPLYRSDKGEKAEGGERGRDSSRKTGDGKNTSDQKRWASITYERTDLKYLDKYPHDLLDRFGIIPLTAGIRRDRIYWAVLDPFDLGWRVFLNELRQPNESEYLNIIDIVDYECFLKEMSKRQDDRHSPVNGGSMDDGSQGLQYEAIPARMQKLLQDAQDQRASDIHIEADENKSVVRFRVDGVLHIYAEYSKETHNAIVSHFKVRTQMDVTEKRRPQDGRLTLSGTDIRASTYPTVKGEKFVLRLLDQESIVKSTDLLGMLPFDLQLLRTNISSPNGLILICGPTGSGKTTTLYACLSELNKPDSNIMTIEEPVEYQLHGINQMQVRADIDLTFEKGLRTILRQDPDIIMVGEIRDQNTARTAIQAAMTGHLVLSTIHTNSAPQAVSRLLEMGVEPYMITSALNLTVSQRLVRRVCLSCRQLTSGSNIRKKIEDDGFDYLRFTQTLGMEIPLNDNFYIADPNGCPQCFNRGYRGRMAIFETFNMTREVRDRIHANVTDAEDLWMASRGAKWQGRTLWAHARYLLMRQGVTTFDEIIRIMGL